MVADRNNTNAKDGMCTPRARPLRVGNTMHTCMPSLVLAPLLVRIHSVALLILWSATMINCWHLNFVATCPWPYLKKQVTHVIEQCAPWWRRDYTLLSQLLLEKTKGWEQPEDTLELQKKEEGETNKELRTTTLDLDASKWLKGVNKQGKSNGGLITK